MLQAKGSLGKTMRLNFYGVLKKEGSFYEAFCWSLYCSLYQLLVVRNS